MVQPFDASRLATTGEAFPVAENIANPQNYRLGDFSVSLEGTLVYQKGQTGLNQVEVRDAEGREIGTVGDAAAIDGFRLSPDGALLVEQVSDARSKNVDLWLVDLIATSGLASPSTRAWSSARCGRPPETGSPTRPTPRTTSACS